MNKQFIALTTADAKNMCDAFQKGQKLAGSYDFPAVKIAGAWRGRRFVIATMERYQPRSVEVWLALDGGERLFGVEHGVMVVPVVNDPDYYANELRSFGMKVAFAARRKSVKAYDNVQGSDDEIHSVLAYHHIAECGYRGPWIEGDGAFNDGEIQPRALSCAGCVSSKKKRLRLDAPSRAKSR